VLIDLFREGVVSGVFSDAHAAVRSRDAIGLLAIVYPDAADYPHEPRLVAVRVLCAFIAFVTCAEVALWRAVGYLSRWAGIPRRIWTAPSGRNLMGLVRAVTPDQVIFWAARSTSISVIDGGLVLGVGFVGDGFGLPAGDRANKIAPSSPSSIPSMSNWSALS